MKISAARLAAFEILQKIETEKSFSSVLLPMYEEKLVAKDRALCHALTLGVLRRQIYLDRVIEKLTNKPAEKLDAVIRIILRLGLFQLLFLDKIPAHAAINEAVNLAQKAKKTSAKGLVNAVLRRATREKIELNFSDEIEKISVENSHPRWLIEKWTRDFGLEEAAQIALANNETPNSIFRLTAKSDENTVEILKKLGLEVIESKIVKDAWKISNSNEMLRVYADEGRIYFQDEASQLVAQTIELKTGETFLDVCAAPGSKTTYVAKQKEKDERQKIIAGDFYDHRVRTLQSNCRRQGADSVEIVRYDAEKDLPFADESFDWVLVDAPCSGTGTIRHNPEIRYFLRETDFAELSLKQLRILQNASKLIKASGKIVYSTCSLEWEENEAVAEKFLAENEEFQKVEPPIAKRFLTENDFARTFPHRDKTDGFFVAVFEKKRVFGKV